MNRANFRSTIKRFGLGTGICLVLDLVSCGGGGGGSASTPLPTPPGAPQLCVDGAVEAIATGDDGTVYVGGQFTRVSEYAGAVAAVDTVTGERVTSIPTTDGYILTCLPDGSGGYFIGGYFTQVNGAARKGLAHILANGTVDPVWKPEVEGTVGTMIHVGGSIFFGGGFQRVNGLTRTSLAIVDDTYGSLVSTAPVLSSNYPGGLLLVSGLLMDGTNLYVVGMFTGAGNTSPATPRMGAAAFDGNNDVLPWNPAADHAVEQMLKIGNTIYLRGEFTHIGLDERNQLAAVDATSGQATAWNPVPTGNGINIQTMAARYRFMGPTTLLVGGLFHTIGNASRDYLAELDRTTGNATSWNPAPDGQVNKILTVDSLLSTSQVFACGQFTSIGGSSRTGMAELTLDSGAATPWNSDLSGHVSQGTLLGQNLYLFGSFYTAGVNRQNLAAFDANGQLKDWAPSANGQVLALCYKDGLIYTGGAFTTIDAVPRHYLAALDTHGNLDTWDPDADGGTVWALAAKDNLIFAGGWFTSVGTQNHLLLAAIDAQSGRPVASWAPFASSTNFDRIRGLSVSGDTLYVAGFFDADFTHCLRAVDIATGHLTPWLPAAGGEQYDVARYGNHVLVCGAVGLKAFDAATGQTSSTWTQGAVNTYAMDLLGSSLYITGPFNDIGGTSRLGAAALDATTGALLDWNPGLSNGSNTITLKAAGDKVWVGGLSLHTSTSNPSSLLALPR